MNSLTTEAGRTTRPPSLGNTMGWELSVEVGDAQVGGDLRDGHVLPRQGHQVLPVGRGGDTLFVREAAVPVGAELIMVGNGVNPNVCLTAICLLAGIDDVIGL